MEASVAAAASLRNEADLVGESSRGLGDTTRLSLPAARIGCCLGLGDAIRLPRPAVCDSGGSAVQSLPLNVTEVSHARSSSSVFNAVADEMCPWNMLVYEVVVVVVLVADVADALLLLLLLPLVPLVPPSPP